MCREGGEQNLRAPNPGALLPSLLPTHHSHRPPAENSGLEVASQSAAGGWDWGWGGWGEGVGVWPGQGQGQGRVLDCAVQETPLLTGRPPRCAPEQKSA